MRLLVVEDDARAARMLVSDMADLGHDTVVASDGRAALLQATDEPFDAILLDVMLPHVDGIGVARALRDRGVLVPIVMLTALGDLDQRLIGLDAGADDYLVKPAAPVEIEARIKAGDTLQQTIAKKPLKPWAGFAWSFIGEDAFTTTLYNGLK